MTAVSSTVDRGENLPRHTVYSDKLIASLVLVSDTLTLLFSGLMIYAGYTAFIHANWTGDNYPIYLLVIVINAMATLAAFYFAGLYELDKILDPGGQFSRIFLISAMLFLVLLILAFALMISDKFSRGWVFLWCFVNPFALYFERLLIGKILVANHFRDRMIKNVAIIGCGKQGVRLAELIMGGYEGTRIRLVGLFDDRCTRIEHTRDDIMVSGNVDDLISLARDDGVDDILVALPWTAEVRVMEILGRLQSLPVPVRLSPDMVGLNFRHHGFTHYDGIPTLNVSEKPLSFWDNLLKTCFDILVSTILLLILLPLMVVIALAIKIDSPGSIFFRQLRPGFNSKLIPIIKFRTLHTGSQDNCGGILVKRNDTRVTRVGKFLRRTSLDELPQLINVLKGDMSLVGPRPHPLKAKAAGTLYEKAVSEYSFRHKVKPGLTGWAQVNGWRGETDTEDKIRRRVEHDIYYINNWSLYMDLKIILKTIPTVIKGDGAY